jgi:hypothetical protein
MRSILVVLFAVTLVLAIPAIAQDGVEDCAPRSFAAALAYAADTLEDVAPERLDSALLAVVNTLQVYRAYCAGLSFQGADGDVVIGPVQLAAGTWINEGQFDGPGYIEFTALTDGCGPDLDGMGVSSMGGGDSASQTVIEARVDCDLLIEVKTNGAWEFRFTRAR